MPNLGIFCYTVNNLSLIYNDFNIDSKKYQENYIFDSEYSLKFKSFKDS